ncbi:glucosamine-6-phosphate deaminase [Nocardioides ferulae]|uniref:glucosamine-6-phosphate deaminase n=1 Tax=Nocardioides ferulae TaxID=2340821 RepID=UPI000EB37654|nr:glucosamine-6-phosphate deaminase [Nocardioides ferulae]
MEVVPLDSVAEVAGLAADVVEARVRAEPATVLGLATGSSPVPAYRELARRRAAGSAPAYDRVRVFLLDEYVGLPEGHPQTYRETILREATRPLGIPDGQVSGPDPDPERLPGAGQRYEEALRAAGGVDLQVLGIGSDGHLAFNEPGSSLASLTRIKTLTEETREANARFFAHLDEVPRHVLTQGLGTILRARHLLLVATGAAKAAAVAAALEGPLGASCPASVLQLHPHVSVLLDPDAASALRARDHYRAVYAAKPAWQGL